MRTAFIVVIVILVHIHDVSRMKRSIVLIGKLFYSIIVIPPQHNILRFPLLSISRFKVLGNDILFPFLHRICLSRKTGWILQP